MKNNAPNNDISIILVGNKKDLQDNREITVEEAEEFAKDHQLYFLETSALDNSDQMIEKVFTTLSEDIIKKKDEQEAAEDEEEEAAQPAPQKGQKLELGKSNAVGKKKEKKEKKCC